MFLRTRQNLVGKVVIFDSINYCVVCKDGITWKNIYSVYSLKFKSCGKTAGKKTWARFHSSLLYTLTTWEGKLRSFFFTSWNYILVQKAPWILQVEGNQLTACLNIDVEDWNDENGNTCFRMLSSLNREFWLILFPFFWHGKVSLNMEEIFQKYIALAFKWSNMSSCDYEVRIGNNIRLLIKKDENPY